MYLLGVNLQDKKTVPTALSKIYGIGRSRGETICDKLGIQRACLLKDVSESTIVELLKLLNSYTIESELKRAVRNNIANLLAIGSYRGERHKAGLPVRGQSTRNNAKSARKLNGRQFRERHYSSSSVSASTSRFIPGLIKGFAAVGAVSSALIYSFALELK